MKGNRGVDRWAMAGVAAALGMGAAWVAAAFLALLIAPLSRDQPLGAAALGEWAWRWGRVLAVLLAAAASVGRAPVASPSLVARQAGWTVGVLLALALLAAVLALVAVRLARDDTGWITGEIEGVPTMREGKVTRMGQWLAERGLDWSQVEATFYSDSPNDLPLLERVRHPVATNPDPRLRRVALERGWRVLDLFGPPPADH